MGSEMCIRDRTTSIYSETGQPLQNGYVWSFTRPADSGPARFDLAVADLTSMVADTRALPIGDIDGDGDLDVVAANYDKPSAVFLNKGEGLHWDVLWSEDDEVFPIQALIMGDMDNDGDLDGIAGFDGLPHGVLENVLQDTSLIEPVLWDMAGELSNSGNTRALALGDLDGDGYGDDDMSLVSCEVVSGAVLIAGDCDDDDNDNDDNDNDDDAVYYDDD